jgi:DnaJ-class molecular chaperone
MANDRSAGEPDDGAEPPICPPCRGTGRVISNLGGNASEVPCPWCEGTGRLLPDHDAQAGFRRERATADGD